MFVDTLHRQIHDTLAEMYQGDPATCAASVAAWEDLAARFYNYSTFNTISIARERPGAVFVAGFRRWQEMRRRVVAGERGIPIVAPIRVNGEPIQTQDGEVTPQRLAGFKVVYVFDLSQTEGDPFPLHKPIKTRLHQDYYVSTLQSLALAHWHLPPFQLTAGMTLPERIAKMASLRIAQLAASSVTPQIVEAEAYATYTVTCRHLGLIPEDSPSLYPDAFRLRETPEIMKSLERIRRTVADFLRMAETQERYNQ